MNILDISIIVFILMETSNVFILYFKPKFKYGNGVSVFKTYELSEKDKMTHLFIKYLTNWVAGTKLIFIVLLAVILVLGDEQLKCYSLVVMIFSIATYFFRLAPIIKKLDENDLVNPKGYSKTLNYLIIFFILMFTLALLFHLFLT